MCFENITGALGSEIPPFTPNSAITPTPPWLETGLDPLRNATKMDQSVTRWRAVGQHRQQSRYLEERGQPRSPTHSQSGPPLGSLAFSRKCRIEVGSAAARTAVRPPRRRGGGCLCTLGVFSKSGVRPDGCSGFPCHRRRTRALARRGPAGSCEHWPLHASKASDIYTVYDFRPKGYGE